jgi:hypothetical protein
MLCDTHVGRHIPQVCHDTTILHYISRLVCRAGRFTTTNLTLQDIQQAVDEKVWM